MYSTGRGEGMGRTCNYYDAVVQDLWYYAKDHRRSKSCRDQLAKAASALEAANLELKECQSLLKKIHDAQETYAYVLAEIKRHMEVQND